MKLKFNLPNNEGGFKMKGKIILMLIAGVSFLFVGSAYGLLMVNDDLVIPQSQELELDLGQLDIGEVMLSSASGGAMLEVSREYVERAIADNPRIADILKKSGDIAGHTGAALVLAPHISAFATALYDHLTQQNMDASGVIAQLEGAQPEASLANAFVSALIKVASEQGVSLQESHIRQAMQAEGIKAEELLSIDSMLTVAKIDDMDKSALESQVRGVTRNVTAANAEGTLENLLKRSFGFNDETIKDTALTSAVYAKIISSFVGPENYTMQDILDDPFNADLEKAIGQVSGNLKTLLDAAL